MLLYSYYIKDKIERAWFESSNVVYGECEESETIHKKVKIVFKNGSQYEYKDVNVYDWQKFKHSESQGKALNEIIKKGGYEYKKLDETIDVDKLLEEMDFHQNDGLYMKCDEDKITIYEHTMNQLHVMMNHDKEMADEIKSLLEKLGRQVIILN